MCSRGSEWEPLPARQRRFALRCSQSAAGHAVAGGAARPQCTEVRESSEGAAFSSPGRCYSLSSAPPHRLPGDRGVHEELGLPGRTRRLHCRQRLRGCLQSVPDPGHPLPAGVLREGVLERRLQVGALPTRGASCGDASLSNSRPAGVNQANAPHQHFLLSGRGAGDHVREAPAAPGESGLEARPVS